MALTLYLKFEEQNDAKAAVITDITGVTDSTDWGVGSNINYTDIDNVTYGLTLDINITDSGGTTIAYDTIDLYSNFGPFVDYEDLKFIITCALLKQSGAPIGTTDDTVPDGIWDITYNLVTIGISTLSFNFDTLIPGVVEKAVYNKLRQISTTYACNEDCDSHEIREAMFAFSYLIGLNSSAYVAKTEELLNQLGTLERMVQNGSNITW